MKGEFLIAPMDLVKNASELTTLRMLHTKEMPTLHEWGPGLLLAGPEYTLSYMNLMTSLHSCDRYSKVEEARSSNLWDAELQILQKCFSKVQEIYLVKLYLPVHKKPSISHTHWLWSVRTESSGFVVYPNKEQWELHIMHTRELIHTCDDGSTSPQSEEKFLPNLKILMSMMFRQSDNVNIQESHTVDLTYIRSIACTSSKCMELLTKILKALMYLKLDWVNYDGRAINLMFAYMGFKQTGLWITILKTLMCRFKWVECHFVDLTLARGTILL
jgi:hypothetical protein